MDVVRRMDKPFLTGVTENASHQKSMEDTELKALYALVFLLSSFAATSAQTLDASMIAAYYLDDGCEDLIEQSTTPAQIVATEASIELEEANGFATTAANDEKDGVGAFEFNDEPQTMRQLIRGNEQPTVGDNVGVAIAAANDAEDGPVGATQPSDEARAVDYPLSMTTNRQRATRLKQCLLRLSQKPNRLPRSLARPTSSTPQPMMQRIARLERSSSVTKPRPN